MSIASEPAPHSGKPRVGDASIYRHVVEAGFSAVACFLFFLAVDLAVLTIWQFREDQATSALTGEQRAVWGNAVRNATGRGLLSMAFPLHCAVARK